VRGWSAGLGRSEMEGATRTTYCVVVEALGATLAHHNYLCRNAISHDSPATSQYIQTLSYQ
jgi:hypothetical protein